MNTPTPMFDLSDMPESVKDAAERIIKDPIHPPHFSSSDKQLMKYRKLTTRPQLYNDWERERLALVIYRYIHDRLAEIRAKNKNPYQHHAALYLGHYDWSLLRHECDIKYDAGNVPADKRAAGAVAVLYDCPVYLVNADHHLNVCEVTP